MLLSQLSVGKAAKILNLSNISSANIASRLQKFGFEKDSIVEVLHNGLSAMGPVAVRLGEHTIAIDKLEASRISVEAI